MTLNNCPLNTKVKVLEIGQIDDSVKFRLQELGLGPQSEIKVLQTGISGAKVIARGSSRIAIDAKLADRISVELA